MSDETAVGIDIGNGAWVVVELTAMRSEHRYELTGTCVPFDSIIESMRPECIVAIDAPVGLLDDARASPSKKGRSGDRGVDKGARKWCPSKSSVFPPPTQEQLVSAIAEHERARMGLTREESKRRLANVSPGGISRQVLELVPAIEAARKLKEAFPWRVFEGHPEVAFSAPSAGVLPLTKMSLTGALARAAVLSNHIDVDVASWAMQQECLSEVGADNWLDALAMAVVALDWARGRRHVLKTEDGRVHTWSGEESGIMALPWTALKEPPPRIGMQMAFTLAKSAGLRFVAKRTTRRADHGND